jgi:3-oxoacyl-ACP reductase-like protein
MEMYQLHKEFAQQLINNCQEALGQPPLYKDGTYNFLLWVNKTNTACGFSDSPSHSSHGGDTKLGVYSSNLTSVYLNVLNEIATSSMTFRVKNVLLTRVGKGSIGVKVVKGLFSCSAHVVITMQYSHESGILSELLPGVQK